MAKKRTKQDLYALVTPNLSADEVNDGDEVEILHRGERLDSIGWINSYSEDEGRIVAEVTEIGAALINFATLKKSEGRLHEELDESIGTFVSNALDRFVREESWEMISRSDDVVVMKNHLGELSVFELSPTEMDVKELLESGVVSREMLDDVNNHLKIESSETDPDEVGV